MSCSFQVQSMIKIYHTFFHCNVLLLYYFAFLYLSLAYFMCRCWCPFRCAYISFIFPLLLSKHLFNYHFPRVFCLYCTAINEKQVIIQCDYRRIKDKYLIPVLKRKRNRFIDCLAYSCLCMLSYMGCGYMKATLQLIAQYR